MFLNLERGHSGNMAMYKFSAAKGETYCLWAAVN